MEDKQYISKTDLARNTHQVIREAQRGYTVVVESHGKAEVAIVDILDFQIQRAAIQYLAEPQKFSQDIDITKPMLDALLDDQARCDHVIGHYLAVHLSLARAGELLNMSAAELQMRLTRAGVRLPLGPASVEELKADTETIKRFDKKG